MSRERRVARYVEALLRNRRPPRFEADDEEARMLHAAATLRGGRPGADLPTPEFVAALESRLRTAAAQPDASPGLSVGRRRFFVQSAGIAAAAAAAAIGADKLYTDVREENPAQADLVPYAARWQHVTTVADVTTKGAVPFTLGAVQGYVLRSSSGAITALSAICTHMGCHLNVDVPASRLNCPCHGAAFTTDGATLSPEYSTPLPRIRTRLNGDNVEVLA